MNILKFVAPVLKNKTIRLILTICIYAVILAAVIFRFTLYSVSFEYDEIFTAITTDPARQLSWIWSHWLVPDVHPPLYNVLLWVYNHFAPYGPELWLRLPSMFFGVGALVCGWLMFPPRFGKTARLIFVAMLACNQYMILYAQHARAYSLMLLLSIPLTFWFLDISRQIWHKKQISSKLWGKYAIFAFLLMWTHYFGALLAGIFYILLFLQAWYYKQNLKMFIWLPVITGALFLPWIVPNLLAQLQIDRFLGDNWWANRDSSWYMIISSLHFFFFSSFEIVLMVLVVGASGIMIIRRHKKGFHCPFKREMLLLGIVVFAVLALAGLISLKIFFFIGRYFTEILPALYLLLSLLIARFVHMNNLYRLLLLVAFITALHSFSLQLKVLRRPTTFPARLVSELYRDFYRGREVMVIAIESFPPSAMADLYGYYINKIYKLNVPVTELVHLSQQEREKAFARMDKAFICMPKCQEWKLKQISENWHKEVHLRGIVGSSCLISLEEKKHKSQKTKGIENSPS